MAKKNEPADYNEALAQAGAILRQGQLNDPGEHFPYKQGAATSLLEANPPAGPNGPGDTTRRISDYISQAIIDASAAYVAAQQAYLEDPSQENREAYHACRDELIAARIDHRTGRPRP